MELTPVELVDKYLGEYKDKGRELNVKHCPYCGPNNKSDNQWKFYVNKDTGTFDCKRAKKCGASGSFYDLAKHFNAEDEIEYNNDYKTNKKKYKKPNIKLEEITDKKLLKYLKLRGFDENTIKKCDIKQKDHYDGKIIAFEYYYKDRLTFIKYRNLKKKGDGRQYWREKDTKPILWNMDNINRDKPVVITEGEFDAMDIIQSGYENVVSIPSGSEDFSWIDNCWGFLKKIDKFIIWSDNDKAGKDFENEVVSKLGEENCKTVNIEGNRINDANEMLYKQGENKVMEMIEKAEKVDIEGIIRLADVEYFDTTDIEAVESGIKELDKYINGFAMGEISIWTGENESGKSTFLSQMLIESLDQGYNVCAFSGELPKYVFRNWIEKQMASRRYILKIQEEDNEKYIVPKEVKDYMGQWFYDRMFLYDADKTRVDADKVLEKFKQSAKRYNCKVFLIDNLIKMNLGKNTNNYYRAQSRFIDKCSVFAHKYNCHLHIVAHPKKSDSINKNAISGSGDITNLADRVFAVKNTSKDMNKDHDGEIGILKDRMFGNSGNKIDLAFRQSDLRFAETPIKSQFEKKYKWEKEYEKEDD